MKIWVIIEKYGRREHRVNEKLGFLQQLQYFKTGDTYKGVENVFENFHCSFGSINAVINTPN